MIVAMIIEAVLRTDLVLVSETAAIGIIQARSECGARHTCVTDASGSKGSRDQQ
jgi:hypothetical protein